MNSPFGVRGVILERFGWTYDYLMNGIPWLDVHFMMVDAPRFVPDEAKDPVNSNKNTRIPNEKPKNNEPLTGAQKLKNLLLKHI